MCIQLKKYGIINTGVGTCSKYLFPNHFLSCGGEHSCELGVYHSYIGLCDFLLSMNAAINKAVLLCVTQLPLLSYFISAIYLYRYILFTFTVTFICARNLFCY